MNDDTNISYIYIYIHFFQSFLVDEKPYIVCDMHTRIFMCLCTRDYYLLQTEENDQNNSFPLLFKVVSLFAILPIHIFISKRCEMINLSTGTKNRTQNRSHSFRSRSSAYDIYIIHGISCEAYVRIDCCVYVYFSMNIHIRIHIERIHSLYTWTVHNICAVYIMYSLMYIYFICLSNVSTWFGKNRFSFAK